ncbi:hypothetical protein ACIRPT_37655 [Streptomyces sp. NPDC101227]|uniref:hypothetical protein n=1 Tax=Streptomyces sp. NPDC101227 TaxID=3366136 RepID=UPI0037F15796
MAVRWMLGRRRGPVADRLGRRLDRYGEALVARRPCIRAGVSAAVSPLGRWGATLTGFLNSHS